MSQSASAAFALALGLVLAAPAPAAVRPEVTGYHTPPPAVAAILTAPRLPRRPASVSPDGSRMIVPDTPSLLPIAVLAEPVDKLAGLEILPSLHATRNQLKGALGGFRVVTIATGKMVRAALPADARIGTLSWSTRGDRVACAVYADGGAQLWIVDAASGAARRLDGVALNTVLDATLEWTLDDRQILALTVAPAAPAAEASRVPEGPVVREASGKAAPQRTSRDVLRTEDDRARFAAQVTSQLVRVPVDGGAPQPIGKPMPVYAWSLAPDERHLVIDQLVLPAALGYPYYLFPRSIEVRDPDGTVTARVGDIPLNDRSAISSVARLGPRSPAWSPDGRSLWFFSWQDAAGSDPLAAIKDTSLAQPGTDRLMRLDAPFTGKPVEVASSDHQFVSMSWTAEGRHLVLTDGYQPRRRIRGWWIDPTSKAPTRVMLFERSSETVYDDPGQPLARRAAHRWVLWSSPDGHAIYLSGDGFRPGGQRPFLDRLDLATRRATRLFESDAAHLENPVALLAADARSFVTLRQSAKEPPNYYARTARARVPRALSDYPDPAPALSASKRIPFTFTRSDSVKLNAEVVLPADWKEGQRLPTVFWVYPEDYRSAAAASQNRNSPNRFPSQSTLNPEVLVTQGYAVIRPDIAVVGRNERYVEEIGRSARAALEEAVRRGFCDRDRVAVGGHSYGAFSTVNLLAHTDIFKAGWASDGAYNRTLTPFTFQAEERTLWEARETYLTMSPFLYANQIKAPLLLLHDLDDTNVGTFPLQSERMFEAMNGLGKVCALVEYPYEDHVPVARESVLDYWARVIEWLDRYVKGGGPVAAPPSGEHGR